MRKYTSAPSLARWTKRQNGRSPSDRRFFDLRESTRYPLGIARSMREQPAKRLIENILAMSAHAGRAGRTVVLCYHSVHPSKRFASATPRLFEQQIEWLKEHCDIVPYGSISKLTSPSNGRRPVVAITFDDGYEDNYIYALPTLLAYQVPATVFVTTGLIDRDPRIIRRFSRLWRASSDDVRGLSWTQVSEMREAGLEIGAHTHSHPNLFKMEEPKVLEEIANSKTKLEDHLDEPVRFFAYPFGKLRQNLSGRTIELVASLGFESAAAMCYRGTRPSDIPLSIPRFAVTKDSVQVLAGKVYGQLDVIGLWQERAPLWLSRLVSPDPSRRAGDE